ncbi:MAG: hypothetical protein R3E97_06375 [Candidatus Eisenbacteria bacterium]
MRIPRTSYGNVSAWSVLVTASLVVGVLVVGGCGDDSKPTPPPVPDTTPPAAIIDLGSSFLRSNSLRLDWTAPGDDGESGQATEYDIRFSSLPITPDNWQDAPKVIYDERPLPAFLIEHVPVSGLQPETVYYFVVATRDEADNWSEISNIHAVSTTALTDATPPAEVTDLALVSVSDSSAVVTWTATGDDGDVGTAFAYDIRFSRQVITEENYFDIVDEGIPRFPPVPQPAGTTMVYEVPELEPNTHYYVAMQVLDDAQNRSRLSNNVELTTLP